MREAGVSSNQLKLDSKVQVRSGHSQKGILTEELSLEQIQQVEH